MTHKYDPPGSMDYLWGDHGFTPTRRQCERWQFEEQMVDVDDYPAHLQTPANEDYSLDWHQKRHRWAITNARREGEDAGYALGLRIGTRERWATRGLLIGLGVIAGAVIAAWIGGAL